MTMGKRPAVLLDCLATGTIEGDDSAFEVAEPLTVDAEWIRPDDLPWWLESSRLSRPSRYSDSVCGNQAFGEQSTKPSNKPTQPPARKKVSCRELDQSPSQLTGCEDQVSMLANYFEKNRAGVSGFSEKFRCLL